MHILHTVPSVLTVLPPLVVVVVCPDEFDTNGFHHFWKSTEYLNWFCVSTSAGAKLKDEIVFLCLERWLDALCKLGRSIKFRVTVIPRIK